MRIAVKYFENLEWLPNKNFKGICDSLLDLPCEATVAKYTTQELLHKRDYDAVFLLRRDALSAMSDEHIRHYKKNDILVALWQDDIFYWKTHLFGCPAKSLMRRFEVADILFIVWVECFLKFRQYDKFKNKVVWLPWSAFDSIMDTDIAWSSRNDRILLSGNVGKTYPFRTSIAEYSVTDSGSEILDSLKHYGYKRHSQDKMLTGQAYYDCLKTYKGAVATAGRRPGNFHRAKYMEVSACGCVPFLEYTPDIHYLGFIDGINCILINRYNYQEKFQMIHSEKAALIAQNARGLVKQRHLHSHRAETIATTIINKLRLR